MCKYFISHDVDYDYCELHGEFMYVNREDGFGHNNVCSSCEDYAENDDK